MFAKSESESCWWYAPKQNLKVKVHPWEMCRSCFLPLPNYNCVSLSSSTHSPQLWRPGIRPAIHKVFFWVWVHSSLPEQQSGPQSPTHLLQVSQDSLVPQQIHIRGDFSNVDTTLTLSGTDLKDNLPTRGSFSLWSSSIWSSAPVGSVTICLCLCLHSHGGHQPYPHLESLKKEGRASVSLVSWPPFGELRLREGR